MSTDESPDSAASPRRLLLIEDSPSDMTLLELALRDSLLKSASIERESSLSAGLERLSHREFDAILLDLGLPDSDGIDTFRRVADAAGNAAIVVVTGRDDATLGEDAVRLGAQDYLLKTERGPGQVGRSVAYAIRRQEARVDSDRARQRQSQATARRVKALTEEQQALYVQLANTEARERALLAEAVHDDPLQLIVAAILRLDLLRDELSPGKSEEVDQIATVLETSVDKLRTLIAALTPADLSEGLGPALLHLAEGIFLGTTTRVRVTGLAHVHLTAESKGAAYRIVREALVNARKHAMAKTITLDLSERADEVVLSVSDDGVGTATLDAGRGHLGLSTMRARADAEGANLDIRSTPGLGTTVQLTMPSIMARRAAV